MTTKTITSFHVFLMLALITFWGSSFVVVKILLEEELTPIAIATFRFLIAGALFAISLLIDKAKNRNHRLLIAKKDTPTLLFLGLTGVTFFFIAQYTGIEMAGPSVAAILVTLLSPILITIFSATMLKEHLVKRQILGIGISALGAFTVIIGGTLSFNNNPNFLLGSLIILATPFLWTVYSLLGKKIMNKYDAFLVVSYVNIFGGLCLIPFSLAENSVSLILNISLNGWLAILFLSVTCSLIGYYIWFYVMKQVGAAVTSAFLFAEPVITVLFAVMFIAEPINLLILGGGILIFLGVWQVAKT
jgi:drug/metabolite transporter (DMT)-like permease